MTAPTVPTLTLNTGAAMPQLGFGVFQIPPAETERAVTTALQAGYRSIDTATIYGNEAEVGRAIASSGLSRDELFVTTKVWNTAHGADRARRAFEASLQRLGLDHVDLYLIHWPVPARDLYVETWQALEDLHAGGRARAIGVSNFDVAHLQRLMRETGTVPAVNQIELHPRLAQDELRRFHTAHGIVTEAWSPLAQAEILDDPVIAAIAGAHRRTAAQVVLRWHVQLGHVAIPKSVTPARIAENLDLWGFELSGDEMARITGLDAGTRTGPHPETFTGD